MTQTELDFETGTRDCHTDWLTFLIPENAWQQSAPLRGRFGTSENKTNSSSPFAI